MKLLSKLTLALTILGTSSVFAICADLEEQQNKLRFILKNARASVEMYQELYEEAPLSAQVIQFQMSEDFDFEAVDTVRRGTKNSVKILLGKVYAEQKTNGDYETLINSSLNTLRHIRDFNLYTDLIESYPDEDFLGLETRTQVKYRLLDAMLKEIKLQSENQFITGIIETYCK